MQFIYETPWWLPAGLAIAGAILLWTGNNRQEKKLLLGGAALVLLAVLVAALSWFLESEREIVQRQTREIIKALENRDWKTMERLLHPDIEVLAWTGRDRIMKGAKEYAERYSLRRARIFSMKASQPQPEVTIAMRVFAEAGDMSNTPFDWELIWEKTGSVWLLREVRPLGSPIYGPVDQYFR